MKKRIKNQNNGITLIALVVTVVVLMILAGISIGMLTGDNGIINQAKQGKEETEISEEKEIINISVTQAMDADVMGNIEKDKLQEKLNSNTNDGATEVIDSGDTLVVKFVEKNRYYEIDKDGNTEGPKELTKDDNVGDLSKGGTVDGSEEKPFEINCIEDLVTFSIMTNGGNAELGIESNQFKNQYVILMRTLDFNSIFSYNDYTTKKYGDLNTDGVIEDIRTELTKTNDSCVGFEPINNFQGDFDGKGNEIQNIYINRDEKAAFMISSAYGYIAESIKNLGITGNITSKNEHAAGIIIGWTVGHKAANLIINCWNKANVRTVSGITVAGICTSSEMKIQNCYNEGNIVNEANTSGQAGGIVAGCGGDIVENCYNTGDITAINGTWYVGGIASGHGNNKTTIINSYNKGKITGGEIAAGGILGYNGEIIENCYNQGDVSQGRFNGGIVGRTAEEIYNCYNVGKVSGDLGEVPDGITELNDSEIKNNQSFVETLNNNIGDNTEWKHWKLEEDGYPTFE